MAVDEEHRVAGRQQPVPDVAHQAGVLAIAAVEHQHGGERTGALRGEEAEVLRQALLGRVQVGALRQQGGAIGIETEQGGAGQEEQGDQGGFQESSHAVVICRLGWHAMPRSRAGSRSSIYGQS
ncbi:hypothetical protein FQZ97_785940 [compost metagenome]